MSCSYCPSNKELCQICKYINENDNFERITKLPPETIKLNFILHDQQRLKFDYISAYSKYVIFCNESYGERGVSGSTPEFSILVQNQGEFPNSHKRTFISSILPIVLLHLQKLYVIETKHVTSDQNIVRRFH